VRALLAIAVVALPVLVGVGYSTLAAVGILGPGASGFNPSRVASVLSEPAVWRGVGWSLWVASASTLLATAGAILIAGALRGRSTVDRLGRSLSVLALPVPHIVAAVLGVLILGQSGILARFAFAVGWIDSPGAMPALIYDRGGIGLILALTWKEIPFLALIAFSVLATRGEVLEETARGLGAGPLMTFRHVTFPLLWRGMLPGMVAVFAFVLGSYEAAALLAPSRPLALPLMTLERYTDVDLASRADAFVLVLIGVLLAAFAVAGHEWARARWGVEPA
jgi:putative spermidine/putrescine transport system permease protein